MQRRRAAGLLLLGLLLGTCLAGSRAQWGVHGRPPPRRRPWQGRARFTQQNTPHFPRCLVLPSPPPVLCDVSGWGGCYGRARHHWWGGGPFFVLRWPQPPCVLAVLPGVWIAGDGLAPAGVLLDFRSFLIPFPGRSLGSRLLGNVHLPRTRCRLLSGVLTWLLMRGWPSYMGKLLCLFWVRHNPLFPQLDRGHAGRLGASPGPSPPSGRCGGRVAGGWIVISWIELAKGYILIPTKKSDTSRSYLFWLGYWKRRNCATVTVATELWVPWRSLSGLVPWKKLGEIISLNVVINDS